MYSKWTCTSQRPCCVLPIHTIFNLLDTIYLCNAYGTNCDIEKSILGSGNGEAAWVRVQACLSSWCLSWPGHIKLLHTVCVLGWQVTLSVWTLTLFHDFKTVGPPWVGHLPYGSRQSKEELQHLGGALIIATIKEFNCFKLLATIYLCKDF